MNKILATAGIIAAVALAGSITFHSINDNDVCEAYVATDMAPRVLAQSVATYLPPPKAETQPQSIVDDLYPEFAASHKKKLMEDKRNFNARVANAEARLRKAVCQNWGETLASTY